MKSVNKRMLVLSTIPVLFFSGTIARAQELPQIELNPANLDFSMAPAANKDKPRVSSELTELQNFYLNLTPEQQNVVETNEEVPIESGLVSIEAIATESADALLEALTLLGLQGGASVGKMVSGLMPINTISQAENLTGLVSMRLSRSITRAGAVDNQADVAMRSDIARATNSLDGDGISIGIISDSYNQQGGEAADIAAGELPSGGVMVIDDSSTSGSSDEGRAMAQLIHDIAPGADLLFHTGFGGAAEFATGILELATAGADVIVDDVGNLGQPMFQDGVIAQAVDTVRSNGVLYYSAAGNSSDNSYEAPYEDSGISLALGGLSNLHTFTPGDPTDIVQEILLPANGSLLLSVQWDQPFGSSGGAGSASDIDVFLLDSGSSVLTSGLIGNIGGDAVEVISYTNLTGTVQQVGLVIGVFSGPVPGRIKWIEFFGQYTDVNNATNSATSFGHPNAAGAIAVGAARYDQTPPFGQTPPLLEPFSSHGGIDILFDTAGNAITPVVRDKPELVAPDGSDTSFFGSGDFDSTGFPNFFGTSAAAPHAAAVAALQLECDTAQTPDQVLARQTTTAVDMDSPGFDNRSGAGLIDAEAAVAQSCVPTMVELCNGLPVTVNLGTGVGSATSGDDVILGTSGDDIIVAMGGNDTICALAGNDTVRSGNGDDYVEAGPGNDIVLASNGVDNILGGDGNDELFAGPGDDLVFGGDGDDIIFGNTGNDELFGEEGVDRFQGGSGNDRIETGPGATVGSGVIVDGGADDDIIFGGADADEIRGSSGNDTIFGFGANDRLFGGSGEDELSGGDGDDLMRGNSGNDELNGEDGDDDINGFGSKDTISGGNGNDVLRGSTGNDTISGGDGVDLLQGGGGNDALDGGVGAPDTCDGQGGVGDTVSASCEVVANIP